MASQRKKGKSHQELNGDCNAIELKKMKVQCSQSSLISSPSYMQSQCISQMEVSSQGFDESNIEERINEAVILLLAYNITLKPLKRSEILHNFKNLKGKESGFLIKYIQQILKVVFGLDLVEAEKHKYILVNPSSTKVIWEEGSPNKVLLLLVLSAMFHFDFTITEEALAGFFSKIGVNIKGRDSYFGDIGKKMQEFEKQLYIKKILPTETNKQVTFQWGQRSQIEIKKKDVLNFLCQVYGRNIENMPYGYKGMLMADENSSEDVQSEDTE